MQAVTSNVYTEIMGAYAIGTQPSTTLVASASVARALPRDTQHQTFPAACAFFTFRCIPAASSQHVRTLATSRDVSKHACQPLGIAVTS